jgi:nitroimidazol reductase NimA-like FMN-containing flavoprotein (pyridoxamine 5'-phosphate oxidase superfamily)
MNRAERTGLPDPGDLGRRIAQRRTEMGMSRADLARSAGMVESYVAYVEESADAQLTQAAMARVAAALETTPMALRGGGRSLPPGRGGGGATLVVLHDDESRQLIAGGGVGRLVEWVPERGPIATPLNFAVSDSDVVVRVSASSEVARRLEQRPEVSFEVDQLDEDLAEGWSVLVSGRAEPVDAPGEVARCEELGIRPWASGDRNRFVRLHVEEISGRQLRQPRRN